MACESEPALAFSVGVAMLCLNADQVYDGSRAPNGCPVCGSRHVMPLATWIGTLDRLDPPTRRFGTPDPPREHHLRIVLDYE